MKRVLLCAVCGLCAVAACCALGFAARSHADKQARAAAERAWRDVDSALGEWMDVVANFANKEKLAFMRGERRIKQIDLIYFLPHKYEIIQRGVLGFRHEKYEKLMADNAAVMEFAKANKYDNLDQLKEFDDSRSKCARLAYEYDKLAVKCGYDYRMLCLIYN